MIKAVYYARSSKDRADVSIDAQIRLLKELAQERDILIVGGYEDSVFSGKDDDRPAFQNMLREMRSKTRTWDHILVLDTARIARRRHISIIFEEHECKRNNIRVIYKSLPDSDPITEMLLKSILQAMDEWHSLTSKVKGLAGMAENVKQGWRAGGSAPRGYKLDKIETGTMREGVAVTKSKLILGDEALLIRAYLQHRARGVARAKALSMIGLDIPITSLIDLERNALTYAGHTVWNRHAERQQGGYVGGQKYRPRNEWVIQRNTHEPLITDEEAEILLQKVGEVNKRNRLSNQNYILAGILKSVDGQNWHGNKNAYRLGKGKQIAAHIIEKAILKQIVDDLSSDEVAENLLQHYKALAKKQSSKSLASEIKNKIAETDKKITKLADLISETTKPAALLRKIEELELVREKLASELAAEIEEQNAARTIKQVGHAEIKTALKSLTSEIENNSENLKEALAQIVDSITLTADASTATINYKLSIKSRDKLASPRATVLNPTLSHVSFVYFPQRRVLA